MRCILSHETDPAFNLAAEEVLLHSAAPPVLRLWRNRRAVIVGRNQNPYTQIRLPVLRRPDTPVIRRISGGGTVFHDPGNVNFTLITPSVDKMVVDYRTPLAPVQAFLVGLGISADFDGANSLMVAGRKISGNAQHIQKGKVLHHGTLLFDTDLEALSQALLAAAPTRYRDKSVDSVRQPVANIRPLLGIDMTVSQFMQALAAAIRPDDSGRPPGGLTPAEDAAARRLVKDKYATWQWNFGHSPEYTFVNRAPAANGGVKIRMAVTSGVIRRMTITGDGWPPPDRRAVARRLTGRRHSPEVVADALAAALGPRTDGGDALTAAFF
jgi:lipoate-protein ligase A